MSIKRKDIVDAFVARMKTILTIGGYYTNAGSNVFLWRDTPIADAEIPALNIKDLTDTSVDYSTAPAHSMIEFHELGIEVEIAVTDVDTMRQVVQDVRSAIAVDEFFGGLVVRSVPLGDTSVVDDQGLKYLAPKMSLRLDYRTQKFKES